MNIPSNILRNDTFLQCEFELMFAESAQLTRCAMKRDIFFNLGHAAIVNESYYSVSFQFNVFSKCV